MQGKRNYTHSCYIYFLNQRWESNYITFIPTRYRSKPGGDVEDYQNLIGELWEITRWLPKFVLYICLRPETTYDRVMKLAPEKKYHNENTTAPKMVVNVVANMY